MRRFDQLFAGRTDAYGTYLVTEQRTDGKQKGRGTTHSKPLTEVQWKEHLEGKKMLGVVPIRLDGSVGWFAGDIDVYTLDHAALVAAVDKHEIPVVVCRSKSGGAHLYCFVDGTFPAIDAIKLMRLWLTKLGHPKSEIFPKQEWVEEANVGNWINLPYFKGDETDRYAYGMSAERLTLAQFEQAANAVSVTPAELSAMLGAKPTKAERDPMLDAPPCVEKMFRDGITEGGRNNALTQIGIWARKAYSDDFAGRITDANHTIFDDPLAYDEVSQIIKNVGGGKYEYLCNVEPMCSLCDKSACGSRKWGVGPQRGIDYSTAGIDKIVKINSDPPIYCVVIQGQTVKMSTDQLLGPKLFRKRVYEVTGLLMPSVGERQHEAQIQLTKIEVEAAPTVVNQDGQVMEAFEDWASTHCPSSPRVEEVLRGNPFFDQETSTILFRSADFIAAIGRAKKFIPDRDVWVALRDAGAHPENKIIKGRQTKVWIYPVEEPWFDLPEADAF